MPFLTPVIYVKLAFDDHKIFSFYLQFCSLKSRLKMLNNIKLKAERYITKRTLTDLKQGNHSVFILLEAHCYFFYCFIKMTFYPPRLCSPTRA